MIDARELRQGNFVTYHGDIIEVKGVVGQTIYHKLGFDFNLPGYEAFKSIPLTEQWLIDFGFEKFEDNSSFYLRCYEKGFIFDRYDSTQARIWWRGRYLGVCQNLGAVNQLQNLYFALTGQELTNK